jgi:hypothetical protein
MSVHAHACVSWLAGCVPLVLVNDVAISLARVREKKLRRGLTRGTPSFQRGIWYSGRG